MRKLAALALVAACSVPTATLDPDAIHPHGSGDAGDHDDAAIDAHPLKPAMLAASPATGTSFGDIVVGQTTSSTYTITNDGEQDSGAIALDLDDATAGFAVADDTCSGKPLAAMHTCTLSIVFAPTAAGIASTTVRMHASPGDEVTRAVDGNGLVPGTVSIISASYDFGPRAVDAGALTHTFIVENSGQVTIGAPMATIGGSVDSYAVESSTCTQMLAPAAQCQIVVRFDPMTVGDKPGSLAVTSQPGGSDSVTLSGTATAHVGVTLAGTGQGSVASNQPGIDCGSGCSADFSATPVTLSATPEVGSIFDGWTSDCTGTNTCTLDLTGAKSVTATFRKLTPQLVVTLAGSGAGAVGSSPAGISCGSTCMAMFSYGTDVTLTATPQTGSTFTGWSGACSGTTPCVVTMDQARSAVATFTLNTYSLLYGITAGSTGDGTVDVNPAGTPNCGSGCASYGHGTNVTVTATPAVGSKFDGWTGCTSSTASCSVAMTQARSVTARFTLLTEDLTYGVTGSGSVALAPAGTSCGAGCARYDYGAVVTLTATAATGWSFDSWVGCPSANGASCTATMDQARTITAKLLIDTHALTYGKTSGSTGSGTVAVNPAGTPDCGPGCASYAYGTNVTLSASAATGSHFDGWTGCTSSTASCTVAMTQGRTVTARFTLTPYTLTVGASASGNIASSPAGIDCGAGSTACSASFDYMTQVQLVASPATGWLFDTWTGACSGTVGPTCTTTIVGAASVGATWKHDQRLLAVTTFGSGSVTSSPVGISCGSTCMAMFDYGQVVTLTANPQTGASFSAWTGCTSSTNTCTVSMTQAASVTATFVTIQNQLTWSTGGTGAGAISVNPAGTTCGAACASYDYNTQVTLTATPATGSTFGAWIGCASATNVCTVTMTQARSVTAAFTLVTYSFSATTTGSGTLKCNGVACASSYAHGTNLALTATPATGWLFDSWTGACSGTTTASCSLTITQPLSVGAVFVQDTRALSVTIVGAGTVTSSPAGISCSSGTCTNGFPFGQSVTLTPSLATGYSFSGWTGPCTLTGNQCVVTMDQARAVTATFTLNSYPLTVTQSPNGTITSSPAGIDCGNTCSKTFTHGTTVNLTAMPATGYQFVSWGGACSGSSTTCTITMTGGMSVTASYALIQEPLTVAITGSGSVASNPAGISCPGTCNSSFGYGAQVSLTATPAPGWSFGGWGGACTGQGSTCTVTMNQLQNVSVAFNQNQYNVTVSFTGSGTGSINFNGTVCSGTCAKVFTYGAQVTITASPGTNMVFSGWGAPCSGTGTCTFTVTGNANVTAQFTRTYALHVVPWTVGTISGAGISCGGLCDTRIPAGTPITLQFDGDGCGNGGSYWAHTVSGCTYNGSSTCTTTVNADTTIQVLSTFNDCTAQ
jgi:uncharacterized repeat protein (TIGR02543 family)